MNRPVIPAVPAPTVTIGTAGPGAVAAFADAAAFSVVLLSAVAVPLVFSTAQADVFAFPKTAVAIGLAVVLAGLLVCRWIAAEPSPHIQRSALTYSLIFFAGWSLIAWWFAVDRTHALFGERLQFQGLVTALAYVVFLVGAWMTVRGPRRQLLFFLAVTATATVISAYALMQRAGLDPIWPTLPHDRVFSTIGQANALAAYIVLAIFLTTSVAARGRLAQVGTTAAVALMLLALAFTLSRGGYVGFLTGALVLVSATLLRGRTLLTRRRLAIAALVVIAAVTAVVAVPDARAVAQRVGSRALLAADLSESSTRLKLDMWTIGVAISADHPLVGVGQDGYVLVSHEYRDQVLSPERAAVMSVFRPESPHNVYLAIADGAGLPALAAYLSIILTVGARIIRTLRRVQDPRTWPIAAGLLAAIAGHLITDLFMTAETSGSVLFWSLLGVGAALPEISEAH